LYATALPLVHVHPKSCLLHAICNHSRIAKLAKPVEEFFFQLSDYSAKTLVERLTGLIHQVEFWFASHMNCLGSEELLRDAG
jgi:hypothetical protein